MRMRGDGYDALVADLEAAVAEVVTAAGTGPGAGARARPGRAPEIRSAPAPGR
jgi:hypothetical protein